MADKVVDLYRANWQPIRGDTLGMQERLNRETGLCAVFRGAPNPEDTDTTRYMAQFLGANSQFAKDRDYSSYARPFLIDASGQASATGSEGGGLFFNGDILSEVVEELKGLGYEISDRTLGGIRYEPKA